MARTEMSAYVRTSVWATTPAEAAVLLARHERRTKLAAVIHASEHHGECPGQCYATAERVLEAMDGER